ncbi:protein-cysteine N-palmitoyltransferase HHAT-like isoform X1 [Limulus polyphemus]|uniref:Protein-cysteine N-palmitoyltransferase HHAT-like isoform X1 n=2 Tax=Limulus polyphemus TaxID=6850 RepID=A0ABM1TIC1_LIMPO|nr:protein-cysteine N-palmitoyltransferase HHAT-like isoform X1 [Limulus polyphemus]XP_022255627.1 protein-cysteine N-palmitoyltransferase HHAT-like isoform X1 [Limulus polyphemus]
MRRIETNLYWGVWCGGVIYSLYCFAQSSKAFQYMLDPTDFVEGWSLFSRQKDNSDYEWLMIQHAIQKHWLWIVLHIFLSQMCQHLVTTKGLNIFFTGYTTLFLLLSMSWKITVCFAVYVLLMFGVHKLGRSYLCFGLTTTVLFFLHNNKHVNVKSFLIDDEKEGFLLDVGMAWLSARCVSFSLDRIWQGHQTTSWDDVVSIYGYCFYLPLFFTGPITLYSEFVEQLNTSKHWTANRLINTFMSFLHYLVAYLMLELFQHFVYSSAIQFYPEVADNFDSWTLCGLGYALPVAFYLKYFVIYGAAGTLASLDGLAVPPPPKCISRLHRCTFLWRHFDRGLHLWILRYLYQPIVGESGKLCKRILASSVSFGFVSLWHGLDKAVCIWGFFNFVGVASEMLAGWVSSSRLFQIFQENWLSVSGQRRFESLCAAPFFMLMCISCIFFLSNWNLGWKFINKIALGFPVPLLPVLFIMYCGGHVSLDVQEWERRKEKTTT